MIKGLFYASLGAGAALMVDYVFNITGNSHYMTKQLLVALGQPIPPHEVYSRYEKPPNR